MRNVKGILLVLLAFGFVDCNNKPETSLKYKIVAQEKEKFIPEVEALINLLKTRGNKITESKQFQKSFKGNPALSYKKGIVLNPPIGKKNATIHLKYYFIESLDGCEGSVELFFEEVKNYKNKKNERSVFAIFNNYSVVVLTFVCSNDENKLFAKEIIPLVYKTFKLPDSKIMNVDCGNPLKDDALRY